MKWAVVVPTCRRDRYEQFYDAWKHLFVQHSVELITVWDEPPWENIPDFIPRRTDMIRSWGFYRAWENGATYTLSLDDDVTPLTDVFAAYEAGFERDWACSPYLSTGSLTDSGLDMRGFPYEGRGRKAAVQYGGWDGVPDLDAVTQLSSSHAHRLFDHVCLPVPRGVPVTTCAMNFAFRTSHTPLMWQLPLLDGRYNRFGDIWSGLIQKKVLDAQGDVMLVNGKARVHHDRASDPFTNLEKEAPGLRHNENLWNALGGDTFLQVSDSFARFFLVSDTRYATHFYECRDQWLSLFAT